MRSKFAQCESGKDTEGVDCCFGCCYCSRRQRCIACTCLLFPIVFIVCLIAGILINTAFVKERFERRILSNNPPVFIEADADLKLTWAKRLGDAIKIKTISYNDSAQSFDELAQIQNFIQEKYPSIHSSDYIEKFVVHDYSLVYRIQGTLQTKNPYLLCAHMDVVPEGNLEGWSHDPFLGEVIKDEETGLDFIFGRGAIDDKQAVFGILEALEHIVKSHERPKRTFYLAFGHDEELRGHEGAGNMAKKLEELFALHNEKLDFMVDEGMFVMEDIFPGLTAPIICVGVVEKGSMIIELSVNGVQGHSSKPPRESAIGILAHAIAKLEDNQQPSHFGDSVESEMMAYIAPHTSFLYKMVIGNFWIFSGLMSKILGASPNTDAIQRTTTAVTIVNGGVKINVVPNEAKAYINHRVHPSDTIDDVIRYNKEVIDDDRVNIKLIEAFVPSRISDYSNDALPFQILVNSAMEVYPEAHVAPALMIANTDTRHYQNLSDTTFRFSPILLNTEGLDRFHGLDERISVDNYAQNINFFYRLMKNADYDVKEKSYIESQPAFEGSGVAELDSNNDVVDYHLLDDRTDEEAQDKVGGSSEL